MTYIVSAIKRFLFWREYRKFVDKLHEKDKQILSLNIMIDRLENDKIILKSKLAKIPDPKNAKERAKNWYAENQGKKGWGNKYP